MPRWKWRSVNKSFIYTLWEHFAGEYFTTKQAEEVYCRVHADRRPGIGATDDYWRCMTARNCIAAAVHLKYGLKRVRKGVYAFRTRYIMKGEAG